MATQIQVRRDTLGDWNTANPILAQGEVGVILDGSNKVIGLKVGDGTSVFKDLENATPMLGGVPNQLDEDASTGNPDVADKTTFLLKGLTNQSAAVFGIEATGSTELVLSIDKAGGITAAAGVNVSGGYDATNDAYGISIDTNGNVQSNTGIESGDYNADCSTGGVLLSTDVPAAPDETDPTYGKLEISVKSGVTATDNVIAVRNNNAEVFVVDADGDIDKVKNITATGLTTTVGLTNSGAVINAGTQKITNVVDPTDAQGAVTINYLEANRTGWVMVQEQNSLSTAGTITFSLGTYSWTDFSAIRIEVNGENLSSGTVGRSQLQYRLTNTVTAWTTFLQLTSFYSYNQRNDYVLTVDNIRPSGTGGGNYISRAEGAFCPQAGASWALNAVAGYATAGTNADTNGFRLSIVGGTTRTYHSVKLYGLIR